MEEDQTITLKDALAKATNAHNMQINRHGFSPRHQGIISGVTDGTPATWEPVTHSDALRRDFINRQQAEEIYRKSDSNERIQKSLAGQMQGYVDAIYPEGELVLYKEKDSAK